MKQHRDLKSNLGGETGSVEEGDREMEWRGRVGTGRNEAKGQVF